MFHRCNSLTGWGTTLCTLALDSTHKVEGQYSIKMTTTAVAWADMHYSRTVDWSEFKYLVFSVYCPGGAHTGRIWVKTDVGNYKYWNFFFAAEWTERTIDLTSAGDGSAGALDLSDITLIEIQETQMGNIGDTYYFDFFHGKTTDITGDIVDIKITEEMGMPSYADMKIKGSSLDHFQSGLELDIYDKDDELSWTGRILFPEGVLEGTKVVGKIKALGSNSQFENTYRKNYTTARSSDYILKDIIDNALTKYHSYDEITDFSALTFKYDHKSKIQKTLNHFSMLERAVIDIIPSGVISLNKYDNLSKGPQIYQATYNFEDDAVGSEPVGWTSNNGADCTTTIIAELDGHKKVLQISDFSGAARAVIYRSITQGLNTTIEFYVQWDVNESLIIEFYEGATALGDVQCNNNSIYWYNGGYIELKAGAVDTRYHVKVIFDDTANTVDCYVDGALAAGGDEAYENNSTSGVDKINLQTGVGDTDYRYYISAIGISADPNYTVGDNLKCWDETTKKIKITSYTPSANRHITRTPVIGANNDLGQVYYVGEATDAVLEKYGINQLQPWRDPEITNYTEAKQLGDNLLAIYSLDTQMIAMIAVGKGHLQVGKTLNLGWAGVFTVAQANFLLTKRVWHPIRDISELELTDNILTRKAFNVKVINKFYDEDAQQSYDVPDVAESTVAGTVQVLRSISNLRANAPIVHIVAGAPDVNYDVADGVEIGDLYVDTTNTKAYICLSNAAAAADWNQID